MRNLSLPGLGQIPGLRAYDATTSDKETVEQGLVNGTRTLEQLLVPERTGEIEIPSLSMDVFDPAQKAYRTVRTEPIRLQIHAAAPSEAVSTLTPAQNLLAAGGMRPIRLRMTHAPVGPPPWTRTWFWPLLGAGPAAVALLLGTGRARQLFARDPALRRVKRARRAARARLRGAESLLDAQREGRSAPAEFYAEVARALTGYLADKQGVVAAGLTREELARALAERGHAQPVVRALIAALDECDQARFAPGKTGLRAQQALLERADKLLADLDRARRPS